MSGYNYHDRSSLPNYWAYADRFVLADHFFTSMYGPTFPEHLYAVAAQADGIVDNKTTIDHPGSYCDDPTEFTPHFRDDLTDAQKKKIMSYEEHYTNDFPNLITRSPRSGRTSAPASTSRRCPTSSRRPASTGSTTPTPISG